MVKEYNDNVKSLGDWGKKALRKQWEEKLVVILDDDVVAISVAAHLKKVQKYMLEAVRGLLALRPPTN